MIFLEYSNKDNFFAIVGSKSTRLAYLDNKSMMEVLQQICSSRIMEHWLPSAVNIAGHHACLSGVHIKSIGTGLRISLTGDIGGIRKY